MQLHTDQVSEGEYNGLFNVISDYVYALDTYGNGVIAIAASYSSIFNGLFNFQSYNAVIKFGAEALEQK